MSPTLVYLLLLAVGIVAIALGTPVAYVLWLTVGAALLIFFGWPPGGQFDWEAGLAPVMGALAEIPYEFAHSYELASIPLYVALGHIADRAGITTAIFTAAQSLLARVHGGLGMATVLGCGGFSAISGSSIACAATMGKLTVPEMIRRGYHPSMATGLVAAGGTLGALIPPSIPFIVFAILAEHSVGQLLLAGLAPGLLTLLGYLIAVAVWARIKMPAGAEASDVPDGRRILSDCLAAWPALALAVIIIGGIFWGFFTTIQAAAVSVLVATVIGWAKRSLTLSQTIEALRAAATQTTVLFVLAFGAKLFIILIAASNLAGTMIEAMAGMGLSPLAFILIVCAILIVMGMFLEPMGILLILVPITLPMVESYGLSVVWYAALFVKLLEVGLITPPMGMNVFVLKAALPDQAEVSIGGIFRGITLFLVVDAVVIAVLIAFPELVTWVEGG